MPNSAEVFPPGFRVVNGAGQPVSGAQIRFFLAGTTTPLTVYADKNLTQPLGPIVYTRSDGFPVANQGSGNAVLVYVGVAPYKVDILDANGVNIFPTQDNVQGALGVSALVSIGQGVNQAALKAASTPIGSVGVFITQAYSVDGDAGGGTFAWSSSNHAADITNDPKGGVFVPPNSDVTGASGAWVRQYVGPIHVRWFGSLVANASDGASKSINLIAFQAAIDFAYTYAKQTVEAPAGIFYLNPGLYLDAPGNLRSNLNNPTIFNFSLHLKGVGGLGNHEGHGTQIHFTDNTTNALIVGTGQGMRVSDLSILGPSGATSRAALPANGMGIMLAGGNGGLTRVLVENCAVENFRYGITAGSNFGSLCDSITIRKCWINSCYTGYKPFSSQNFIQSLEDNVFQDCTIHIDDSIGRVLQVRGGNYSTTNANRKVLTIGSVSALSSFTDTVRVAGTMTNWQFTVTLSASNQQMTDGAFDAFAIVTTSFGVVPLELISYNSGTRVATLKLRRIWLAANYSSTNMTANTNIQAELQAATALYACETVFTFKGSGIIAQGAHVENPGVLTCVIDTSTGVDPAKLEKCFFDYNVDQHEYFSPGTDNGAIFYCQQTFPFINALEGGGLVISDCAFNQQNLTDGVVVEVRPVGGFQFVVQRSDLPWPNVLVPFNGDAIPSNFGTWPSTTHGAGDWDYTPFTPHGGGIGYVFGNVTTGPFQGWRPSPWTTPRLQPTDLANIIGGPGSFFTYPLLHGEAFYSVVEFNTPNQGQSLIRSSHRFFSYGQNITTTWTALGQSNVVRMTDTTKMFAGLNVQLNGGTGGGNYMVTGVYPTLGYITIHQWLNGTLTVTYTDTAVQQEAYSFSKISARPASKFVTNTNAGAQTAQVGDLTGAATVNLSLTSVGAANYTTRTAAQMFGDIPGAIVGESYMLSIQNSNAGTTTLVGGTGVTVTGTATIAQGSARLFNVTFPTATTCTITSLGTTSGV